MKKFNANKFFQSITRDLWVFLLDVVAVNASYYLALLIRFYVNSEFRPTVSYLLGDWASFAPWYTVISIVIFMLWRLYGGMWRYAGINDMNRIIAANVCTSIVQIVGTLIFVRRMPITYYVIGAVLQFIFIAAIRFGYRLIVMESNRIRHLTNAKVNVMIVGVGETARILRDQIEKDGSNVAKPVCLFSYHNEPTGKMINGLPVLTDVAKLTEYFAKYQVKCVILADSLMPVELRKNIREACHKGNVEVQDFSGYLTTDGHAVTLKKLMEYASGSVEIKLDGKVQSFKNGETALMAYPGRYEVKQIYAKGETVGLEITQKTVILNDTNEDWVKDTEDKSGEEISFF